MTLDLAQVSPQLRQMGKHLAARGDLLRERLIQARATLHEWAPRWEELRDLVETREQNQRIASPREPLDTAAPQPVLPSSHRVIATDGSQIEQRHRQAEYFLLNVGWAAIQYGAAPRARLFERADAGLSQPICSSSITIVGGASRSRVVTWGLGDRCGSWNGRSTWLRSAGASCRWWCCRTKTYLAAVGAGGAAPEDFLRDAFLWPYCRALERCQQLRTPIASYIRPRSTEVSALLRLATCQGVVADCRSCRLVPNEFCALEGMHDRLLFNHLKEGERSAVFAATLHEKAGEVLPGPADPLLLPARRE